ncbi:hypothetical protein DFJ73DRAFT_891448 [Zopfochytrium polystomum]|nr:hypothetical protein DFJ73DRAFT_891448 [Zopfochytrium polystomum]
MSPPASPHIVIVGVRGRALTGEGEQEGGAVRGVVDARAAETIWVPYDGLFRNLPHATVIHARAAAVREHEVVLEDGRVVEFDYVVVATGSAAPSPGQARATTREGWIEEARAVREALEGAKTVAIVGGGPVGIELAGELATDFPHLTVDLLTSGPTVLSSSKKIQPAMITATAARIARAEKVRVHTGQRVSGGVPAGAWTVGYSLAPTTLTTTSGGSFAADLVFLTTGAGRPHSEAVVAGLGPAAVNERGYVRTLATGQVVGHERVFALGDVSTLDELKEAYVIEGQAPVVAGNIAALVKGRAASREYKPATSLILVVSFGRNGGTSQLPFGFVFGDWTTWMFKAGDLMVPRIWSLLNLKVPTK